MKRDNLYRVCLLVAEKNPHSACFVELALLLKHSFTSLGLGCDIALNSLDAGKTNIILGSNLLSNPDALSTHSYIVYQLEQLSNSEGWFSPAMRNILRNAREVWDYSTHNIAFLNSCGIDAKYLPIGYHSSLEVIPRSENKDIDIFFYGSVNERRRNLLNRIAENKSIHSRIVFGVYGPERDKLIAQSKIVLNIHFYEARRFEEVRVSYLLNNGCFVISEDSPDYPYAGVELEQIAYDSIIDRCNYYLSRPAEMEQRRAVIYKQFKTLYPMEQLLEKVLG